VVGRTHGIHAEPTTFGLKLALLYDEVRRQQGRFKEAAETMRIGKLSGAVGTFAHLPPDIEEKVMAVLKLKPAPASSQVIQRDRHAHYITSLALIGATLEKIAVEVRHLQRTEVREAEEYFSSKQKGSSAMPHKRNPITSEQIAGLARILRSNAVAAMENVALWHERDISHSSVERIIFPDSTILADYLLDKTATLIEKLVVYPDRMKQNLELTHGLIYSGELLLALVAKNVTREDAYRWVQRNAMRVWDEGGTFKDKVLSDPDVQKTLSRADVDHVFDSARLVQNVDRIFSRVFNN
jgi:adenylosuccinate lyase